jgi:hypothetical protein
MGRADSSFEVALNAEVLPHLPVSLREAASFDKRGNIRSRNLQGARGTVPQPEICPTGRRKPEKATAREREDGPETEQANRESGKGQAGEAPQDQDNGSISEIRQKLSS